MVIKNYHVARKCLLTNYDKQTPRKYEVWSIKLHITFTVWLYMLCFYRNHHVSRRSSSDLKDQSLISSTSTPHSVSANGGADSEPRQSGHVVRLNPTTHLSKQTLWKKWEHLSSLISSPSSILQRHTAHSAFSSAESEDSHWYRVVLSSPAPYDVVFGKSQG